MQSSVPDESPGQSDVLRAALSALSCGGVPGALGAFDLDSTLFDNRPRQARIVREWGAARGEARLAPCGPEHFDGWDLRVPLRRLGFSSAEANAAFADLKDFWGERFFTSEYCVGDAPIAGAAAFVRTVVSLGARVVYLTGRHEAMRAGTEVALAREGFPLPRAGTQVQLWMKPELGRDDDAFKREACPRLRLLGGVAAAFDNEPAHANIYRAAFPEARVVHLDTDHSGRPIALAAGILPVKDFRL